MKSDPQTTPESLLAEYHAIAVRVDERAQAQEDHAKKMMELAKLAKTDQPEALRRRNLLDRAPRVWDFGDTVADLRALKKKSAKLLRIK